MIHFEGKYFQKISFEFDQINKYFDAARKSLSIAKQSYIPEVVFKFSYDALIKLGIALIAKHNYKVRSATGHHIKILEKMGEILHNLDIETIGNNMRQKRNIDLYEGGFLISKKDSQFYLEFIERIFKNNSESG